MEEGEEEAEAEMGALLDNSITWSESMHNEACPVCQEGGEVICCDTCPAVYHLECISPPLRKVPRGKWSCPQCKSPSQEKERGKLKEKNSDGRTSARVSRTRQVLDFDEEVKDIKPAVASSASLSRKRTQTDPVRAKSPPKVSLAKRRSAAESVDSNKTSTTQSSKRIRGESHDG